MVQLISRQYLMSKLFTHDWTVIYNEAEKLHNESLLMLLFLVIHGVTASYSSTYVSFYLSRLQYSILSWTGIIV